MRGATLRRVWRSPYAPISIHAPLAGCDLGVFARQKYGFSISIHAPLAGCDAGYHARNWQKHDFNPRTPCGVRRDFAHIRQQTSRFQSTHPLRGATGHRRWFPMPPRFQSTHPLRGATEILIPEVILEIISIHAPLAGCDPHYLRRRHYI